MIIDVDISETEAEFQRLTNQLSDSGLVRFQEEKVWPWLQIRTRVRFMDEGDDAVGGKWSPLSFPTQLMRHDAGYPEKHPINVRTGGLRSFAMTKVIEREPGGVSLSQPGKGTSTKLMKKLEAAQRGGISTWGNDFPARPVVGLAMFDARKIEDLLLNWVEQGGHV